MIDLDELERWIAENPHPVRPESRVQLYAGDWAKVVAAIRASSGETDGKEWRAGARAALDALLERGYISATYEKEARAGIADITGQSGDNPIFKGEVGPNGLVGRYDMRNANED
jgi:predicted GNAT superfamily acetyltransferase